MPGLYGITTRAPGTLITALIYNSDHQVHVDGRAAEFMQAYGSSLAQFNAQESPFGPDTVTESLPLSLAGELTRLRYVIATVKTLLNGNAPVVWWTPTPAPALAGVGARVLRSTSQSIPDGFGTTISFTGGVAEFNSGVWEGVTHPSRFTAPSDGLYYVAASVEWAAGIAGGRRQLFVGVNGSFNQQTKNNTTATGQTQRQTITGLQKLTAGDYVEFAAFQDSGAALNLIASSPSSIAGAIVYFGATA